MNVNEWGIVFLFGTGYNVSGFSNLTLKFTKPDGKTILTVTAPDVTAPNINVETTAGLFPADTYGAYTFKVGDVDQVGDWSVRLIYDDPSKHLISDIAHFTINP